MPSWSRIWTDNLGFWKTGLSIPPLWQTCVQISQIMPCFHFQTPITVSPILQNYIYVKNIKKKNWEAYSCHSILLFLPQHRLHWVQTQTPVVFTSQGNDRTQKLFKFIQYFGIRIALRRELMRISLFTRQKFQEIFPMKTS